MNTLCNVTFYLFLFVVVSTSHSIAQTPTKAYSSKENTVNTEQHIDSTETEETATFGFVGANVMAYPFQAIGINAGVTDGEIGVRMSVFAGERIGLEGGIFYTLYQKGNFEQQLTALFGYNRATTPSNDSTVSNKAIWIGPAYEVIYKIFHASIGGVLYTEPYQQASKASFQPMFRVGIQYWFDE
jgi:hypothetical protein